MINIVYVGSTSAFFELENENAYYAPEEYEVLIDGKKAFERKTNTFSIFDLTPNTEYTLLVKCASGLSEEIAFKTSNETCALNVKSFGAVGDGVTDDTRAIQSAINFVPKGGRLVFPAGTYLTYPLALRSDFTIELKEDAVILGSPNKDGYTIMPGCEGGQTFAIFEGLEQDSYQSLITGQFVENVSIVGQGRLDGNAKEAGWWVDFHNLPAARPRMIFLNHCKNIMLHGVTVGNSPAWHLHPFLCENIGIFDVLVKSPKDSPNTDAIDPESCSGVKIIGCRFSVGDDCVAIKSGKIELTQKYQQPTEHCTIRNCLMEFGHGAMVLGSEIASGVRELNVTRCYFRKTDRGLRIKSRRGRGKLSVITDVTFENIVMEDVLTPIVMNMWYNCCDPDRFTEYVWSREHLPIDDRTPHLGRFTFKNMVCTGAEVAACYIDGLPESPIDRVAFENISISFAEDAKPNKPAMMNFAEPMCKAGLYIDNTQEIDIKNVSISGVEGEGLILKHVVTANTENFEVK